MTFSWYFPCFAPKYTLFFSTTFSWKPLRFHQCNVRRNLAAVFLRQGFEEGYAEAKGDLATDYSFGLVDHISWPRSHAVTKCHPKKISEERKKGSTNPVKDKHFLVESEDFNVQKKIMYILSLRLRLRRFFSVWNLSHVESFWTHLHSMTHFWSWFKRIFQAM